MKPRRRRGRPAPPVAPAPSKRPGALAAGFSGGRSEGSRGPRRPSPRPRQEARLAPNPADGPALQPSRSKSFRGLSRQLAALSKPAKDCPAKFIETYRSFKPLVLFLDAAVRRSPQPQTRGPGPVRSRQPRPARTPRRARSTARGALLASHPRRLGAPLRARGRARPGRARRGPHRPAHRTGARGGGGPGARATRAHRPTRRRDLRLLRRTDVAGARSLAMRSVRIHARHDDRTPLPEADFVVSSHADLRALLGL